MNHRRVVVTGRVSDADFIAESLGKIVIDPNIVVETLDGEPIAESVYSWASYNSIKHKDVYDDVDVEDAIVVGFNGDDRTARMIRRALNSSGLHRIAKTSPITLIQEELRSSPWKMLCACMLLNKTNHKQVRPILDRLFEAYPRPEIMAEAPTPELASIIKTCGLQNRRAALMIDMSYDYVLWRDSGMVSSMPTVLHGVGEYANDSWRIFQLMDVAIEPNDKELKKYVAWAKSCTK